MSMIGEFGLCPKRNYDGLADLIRSEKSAKTEELVKEIYSKVENSAADLENNKCSGEVFLALFHYMETAYGVGVRRSAEGAGEAWRERTGDFDMVAFHEKEPILALEDTLDCDGLSRFIHDFFQADYGDAGQIAWNVLLHNLKRAGTEEVLIWHLF